MKLYRKFRLDPNGKPIAGSKFGMLGVRPFDSTNPKRQFDVKASAGSDLVKPGEGDLSVYSEPQVIRIRASDLELHELEADDLPSGLTVVPAGEPHYLIEPATEVTLNLFQSLLGQTRGHWKRV